ncbi:MAG: hypothetical protein SGARI_000256 [Bacillariaceae sp.]
MLPQKRDKEDSRKRIDSAATTTLSSMDEREKAESKVDESGIKVATAISTGERARSSSVNTDSLGVKAAGGKKQRSTSNKASSSSVAKKNEGETGAPLRKKAKRDHSTTQRVEDSIETATGDDATGIGGQEKVDASSQDEDIGDQSPRETSATDDAVPSIQKEATRKQDGSATNAAKMGEGDTKDAPPSETSTLLYTDNIMAAAAATNDELEAAAALEMAQLSASRGIVGATQPTSEHGSLPVAADTASSVLLIRHLTIENEDLKQRNLLLQLELNTVKQQLFQLTTQRELAQTQPLHQDLDLLALSRRLELLRAINPGAIPAAASSLLQRQRTESSENESLLTMLAEHQLQNQQRQQSANQPSALVQQLRQRLQATQESSPLSQAPHSQSNG